MKVTLMGPDDLGYWVLSDEHGRTFPLVSRNADHPGAASLFGWSAPEGVTDQEEIIENALDWLMEHTGEDITAPQDVEEYFRELEAEE